MYCNTSIQYNSICFLAKSAIISVNCCLHPHQLGILAYSDSAIVCFSKYFAKLRILHFLHLFSQKLENQKIYGKCLIYAKLLHFSSYFAFLRIQWHNISPHFHVITLTYFAKNSRVKTACLTKHPNDRAVTNSSTGPPASTGHSHRT